MVYRNVAFTSNSSLALGVVKGVFFFRTCCFLSGGVPRCVAGEWSAAVVVADPPLSAAVMSFWRSCVFLSRSFLRASIFLSSWRRFASSSTCSVVRSKSLFNCSFRRFSLSASYAICFGSGPVVCRAYRCQKQNKDQTRTQNKTKTCMNRKEKN